MPPGRKPEWPDEVRDAVVCRVVDDEVNLNRTLRELEAGKLEGCKATEVPYSTARRWVEGERARRARNMRPDVLAWKAAAHRFWRIVGRELDKLERDGRSGKPLDAKRVRETLATLKESKALLDPAPKEETAAEPAPETDSAGTDDLLTRLARERAASTQAETVSTTTPQPIEPARQEGTQAGMSAAA